VAQRTLITSNVSLDFAASPTFGQRAADAMASFGGSWTFIGLFIAIMLLWSAVNGLLLLERGQTFDPYPDILLNLFLSCWRPFRPRSS
jgi:uncharacterized membrane protein